MPASGSTAVVPFGGSGLRRPGAGRHPHGDGAGRHPWKRKKPFARRVVRCWRRTKHRAWCGNAGFVARAGLADRVLPPAGIAAEINRRCQPGAAAMGRAMTDKPMDGLADERTTGV